MKPDVSAAVQGLGAKKTLDRDRALSQFVSQLDHLLGNPEELTSTWQALLALVQDKEAWESRLGGLVGAKAILEALARGNTNSTAAAAVDVEPLFNGCIQWLEDEEPRVRVAVGEVLGRMAQMQGPVVWERAQPAVMASIRENYDRDGEGEKRDRPSLPPGSQHSSGSTDNQQQQQQQSSAGGTESSQQGGQGSLLSEVLSSSYKPKVPGVGEMRHGTEGWRSLETSMRAMVAILDGAGSTVAPHVTPALADLVAQSMHHPNRYVREAAHEGVCALFRALAGATKTAQGSDEHGQGDHSSHESHTQQQAQHFGGVLYPPVADAAAQQQGPGSGVQVDSEQRRSRHTSEQQQQQQQKDLHGQPQGDSQQQQQQQQQQQKDPHGQPQGDSQQHQHQHQHQQQQQQQQQQKDLHGQPQGDSQQQQQQQGVEVSLPALPGCHYSLLGLGMKLAPYIADGLTDNWSQVRRTACVSARTLLLLMLEVHHSFEPLLPVLLPPLCLNRYYVAEGVRSYAQETWQLAMQGQGRMYVAKFIRQVADYYVAQSKAVHHGVREAACMCIAELAEKVERSAVEPHMPRMLHGMLLCFKDMAWPVRDAACVACGRCVLCYPDVCRPKLQELLDLWRAHLWDNVQSVRENSARALADAMKGYPKAEPLEAVHEAIRLLLPKAHEQPVDTRGRFSARSSSRSTSRAGVPPVSSTSPFQAPANGSRAGSSKPGSRPRSFGRPRVASPSAGRPLSPARAMEQALKEDPLFCPSEEDMGLFGAGAAARFSTSFYIKGDGCMDFGFSGEQQPWEASDGAVFMVRELAAVHPEECTQHLQPLVDLVSAAAHNNFEGAPKLRETVWRCLPALAKSIGKTTFKRHLLEGLLPTMMDDLACSTQLTEAAAGKAVGAIRDMLGPSIFQARLSPKQVAVMQSSPHVPPPSGMSVPAPPAGGAVMGPQLGLGRGA